MGGLFKASPPPLPPSLPPLEDTAAARVADEEARRLKMIKRRARGRRGLVTTSPIGLLGLSDISNQQHSLLGE